jgi:hypothetical protein
VTPCSLVEDTNISEKHGSFIFRVKVTREKMWLGYRDWLHRRWSLRSARGERKQLGLGQLIATMYRKSGRRGRQEPLLRTRILSSEERYGIGKHKTTP